MQQAQEIVNMFQSYYQMLGINHLSMDNRFQYCFYNTFNEKMVPRDLKFFKNVLKDHIPKTIAVPVEGNLAQSIQVPVNLDLWLKSYEKNPDPSKFYTTQINSTKDLL
jgi:hypothetical protein